MTAGLSELPSIYNSHLPVAFYIFLRVSGIVAMSPGFGERVVPARSKVLLSIGLTLVCVPIVLQMSQSNPDRSLRLDVALGELLVGLMFGLGLRLFMTTLQLAGSMAAQATSLAQMLSGATVEPLPAIGHLLVVSGLALAMILDLPAHVVGFIVLTYHVFPMGSEFDIWQFSYWASQIAVKVTALAFSMSAPFLVTSLLYNLGLGVINRAMPQLMVAFIGAPVITALAMVLTLVMGGVMLTVWWGGFLAFLRFDAGALQ